MPNSCSIVTLSGFRDIFQQFQASVEQYELHSRKIVVTSRGLRVSCSGWEVVAGVEPFNFSRNANLGIAHAGTDDVLLVNDDVRFVQANPIDMLRKIAYEYTDIGVLSPQFIGGVGSPMQRMSYSISGIGFPTQRLAFTCVYLKRSVLDVIGPLAEFPGYGCEDDDYCRRVRGAGLRLAVTPQVLMRHGFAGQPHSASFFRAPSDPEIARVAYEEKWGERP